MAASRTLSSRLRVCAAAGLFLWLGTVAGCSEVSLEPCDITTKQCHVDVFYALQRMRGDGWDPYGVMPPVEVITRAEYRARLESAPAQPVDPDAPPPAWPIALQLLGIVTRETSAGEASIEDRVANTGAFYSWGTRAVTIIDHGRDRATDVDAVRWETAILLHEFVHAVQHRELAFARFSGSSDASFSWRAAVEGEAVLYDTLADLEMRNLMPEDVDLRGWYTRRIRHSQHSIAAATSPHFQVSWLVYPLAIRKFVNVWLEQGNVGVRRLFGNRPAGAVDWMADQPRPSASVSVIRCGTVPPHSEGWTREGADRFGAAQVYALQVADWEVVEGAEEATAARIAAAWENSLAWVDDFVWVGRHPEHGVAVEWRIRFDTTDAAQAAAELLAEITLRRVEVRGREVVVRGAEDETLLEDWRGDTCR